MYQVGNNQGQVYNGTEGQGVAEYLSMPLTAAANAKVSELNFNLKSQKKKEGEADNDAYFTAMNNVKAEGFYVDKQELAEKYNALANEGAEIMRGGVINPLRSADPKSIEFQKKLQALDQDIFTSKNAEKQYDIYRNQLATGDRSQWDNKSLDESEAYYRLPLSQRAGKMPPKLLKANPYANTTQVITKRWDEYAKSVKEQGGELTEDLIPKFVDNLTSPENMQAGLAQYSKEVFDAMSDVEKTKLKTQYGTDVNGQLDATKVTRAIAKNIVENQLFPQQSIDPIAFYDKLAKSVGDETITIDNATGTNKNTFVNTGEAAQKLMTKLEAEATIALKSNPRQMEAQAKIFGIENKGDKDTYERQVIKKAAQQAFLRKDQKRINDRSKATSTTINNNTGSGGTNSDGFPDWLDRVKSSDATISNSAVNELIAQNKSLGHEIKQAQVQMKEGKRGLGISYVDQNDEDPKKREYKYEFIPYSAEFETRLYNLFQGSPSYEKKKGDRNAGVVPLPKDPLGANKTTSADPLNINK
jgi:hypothetical protein